MKWIEKWKEANKKQEAKDIEHCKRHPTGWIMMMGLFAVGFGILSAFMILTGAYPLAVIAIVFALWLGRQYLKIYRKAFPKSN